jgi:dTMP kinase
MGISVSLTKQPTDFVRNSDIFRTYMDQPDHDAYDYRALSLLCASDRVQHCNRVVLPILESGAAVVSDRYFYSCLANLRARGYIDDLWIYEVARSVPKPDFAFFLDTPAELAVERVRSRPAEKARYIDVELQARLREEYIGIARENDGILLDSTETPEATHQKILAALAKTAAARKVGAA